MMPIPTPCCWTSAWPSSWPRACLCSAPAYPPPSSTSPSSHAEPNHHIRHCRRAPGCGVPWRGVHRVAQPGDHLADAAPGRQTGRCGAQGPGPHPAVRRLHSALRAGQRTHCAGHPPAGGEPGAARRHGRSGPARFRRALRQARRSAGAVRGARSLHGHGGAHAAGQPVHAAGRLGGRSHGRRTADRAHGPCLPRRAMAGPGQPRPAAARQPFGQDHHGQAGLSLLRAQAGPLRLHARQAPDSTPARTWLAERLQRLAHGPDTFPGPHAGTRRAHGVLAAVVRDIVAARCNPRGLPPVPAGHRRDHARARRFRLAGHGRSGQLRRLGRPSLAARRRHALRRPGRGPGLSQLLCPGTGHAVRTGSARMSTLELTVIDSTEGLQALEAPWRRLLASCPVNDLFLEPDWLILWCRHFSTPGMLRVLAFHDNGELVGLAPFKLSGRVFRVLSFAGLPQSDRLDIIAAPDREDEVIHATAKWLAGSREWDMLFLRAFGVFSQNPELLRDALHAAGRKARLEEDSVYPFLDIAHDANEGVPSHFTSKRTREFRRCRRRIGELAPASAFRKFTALDDDLAGMMGDINLNRSLKAERGETHFDRPESLAFLREASDLYARSGRLRVYGYAEEPRLLSYVLCFVAGRRMLAYITSFDKEYAAYGLGGLTILDAIHSAWEAGMEEFDFMEGGERYKYRFTETERASRRLICYNATARGGLLRLMMTCKPALQRMLQEHCVMGAPLRMVRRIYQKIIS
ncbi:GNAT family N-acetyltransferase [Oceanidesulfovibrio marinus]|uniref:GNAT family N-acetyltransferase n=1 Tax=Oceanidesulfovibrio marinus TaxID=370038 RepID=A0ABX6NLT7_9BACT|nr:GNAT family N-acetyltransferase [Oceanidesulfovibrio marinus]